MDDRLASDVKYFELYYTQLISERTVGGKNPKIFKVGQKTDMMCIILTWITDISRVMGSLLQNYFT